MCTLYIWPEIVPCFYFVIATSRYQ